MRFKLYLLTVFMFFLSNMIPLQTTRFYLIPLGIIAVLLSPNSRVLKHDYFGYYGWMLTWMIFILMSAVWAISPKLSIYTLVANVIPIFLLTYSLTKYITCYERLNNILCILYVSSLIMLVYLFLFVDLEMVVGQRISKAFTDEGLAETWNANSIGMNLAMSVFCGFSIVKHYNNKLLFVVWSLISLVMIFVIMLTGSRKALLVLVIPIAIIAMYDLKKRFLWAVMLLLIGVGIFYMAMTVPFFYDIIGNRIEDLYNILTGNDDGTEDSSRKILIEYGLKWFQDSPIIGYGMNCFRVLSDKTSYFAGKNFYAHNNFIEILVGGGLIGFFIFYSYTIKLYRRIKGHREYTYRYVLAILCMTLFLDMALVSYYDVIMQFLIMLCFVILNLEKKKYQYEGM